MFLSMFVVWVVCFGDCSVVIVVNCDTVCHHLTEIQCWIKYEFFFEFMSQTLPMFPILVFLVILISNLLVFILGLLN